VSFTIVARISESPQKRSELEVFEVQTSSFYHEEISISKNSTKKVRHLVVCLGGVSYQTSAQTWIVHKT
jgi:hypothetical protein